MRRVKSVAVLGATGSIGVQALEIVRDHPELSACALAAHSNAEALVASATAHGVDRIALVDPAAAARARTIFGGAVMEGEAGVVELVRDAGADTVLNAIVGAAGLAATLATFEAGADLALANKESLVAGGPLVTAAAERANRAILPVDSEHSALWQCLGDAPAETVESLVITASGGPFRGLSAADLAAVTPEQALAHPTWSMGAKIAEGGRSILAPIDQVGWASAWSGVTAARSAAERPRNGPPEAVITSDSTVSAGASPRHCQSAECSLSTGRIARFARSAAAVTSGPPATRLSLLARARSAPASNVARVAASPAAPTIAFSTVSAPASRTSSTTPASPSSTAPSKIVRARAAAAGSTSAIRSTPWAVADATSASALECAASAQADSSGWSRTISSAWTPIEPVAPRTATDFTLLILPVGIDAPLGTLPPVDGQRDEVDGRAGEEQRIDPVEHAAVAAQQAAGVLTSMSRLM